MKPNNRTRTLFLLSAVIMLVTVACSSGASSGTEEPTAEPEPTEVSAASEPAEQAPAEELEAQEPAADSSNDQAAGSLTLAWTSELVGEGIKPAFDVDANGVVHIAYLTEAMDGGVFYANNANGGFDVEQIAEGYFYGPVDLALGADGTPYIAYHDHQASSFQPNLGDEVVAVLDGGSWELTTVENPGHDGWDNSIVVDADGNWHTAAVDPAQFGGTTGVEYATNAGGSIDVETVGSGPIVYEFGTSIQLDADGRPGVAYYDNNQQTLVYASLGDDGWSTKVVDADGDAGRYAALAFDGDGNPHISYYVADSASTGTVRYARWDGSGWLIEDVGALDSIQMGMIGARKITSLVIGDDGTAHLAYTDRDSLIYARRADGSWQSQEVPTGGNELGQLVELALDPDGRPHLVWFEVTSSSPLNGPIFHAVGS